MFRRVVVVLLVMVLSACSPRLIHRPETPAPSLLPPTETPIPINAPVVTSPALAAIHMLDPEKGWGISETAVLRTTDGGATWYELGPNDAGHLGSFLASSFIDEQHAWILLPDASDMLKGTMIRTSDGGATWDRVQVPFGGGDLQFLDPKNGWMMAGLGAAAGSMSVAVFQTVDAGDTWKQVYTNDPNLPNASDSLPLGGLKDGLSAVSLQKAWIGGVVYSPGTVYLYTTNDGGMTWQQVPVKPPEGYEQAELETRGPQFPTVNTGYLPITISSQNGVMLAVYASRDGGTSWSATPTMIPQGGKLQFVSPADGFVWNGSSFYVTHDGAQTWTPVTPDVAFGQGFSDMDFVDVSTGFVTVSDASGLHALYKTTDGGATWNILGK